MSFIHYSKKILSIWPALFGLGLGLIFVNFQVLGLDLSKIPGDFGDARFVMYLLEHFNQNVTGMVSTYWNAPFFYPAKEVITFSENFIGAAFLYCIPRWLGINMETSFQLFYLGCTVLNFACSYILFYEITKCKYASTFGAMVFSFSLPLLGFLQHAQVFPRFYIPLAFLFGIRYVNSLKPIYLFLSLLFAVLQLTASIYLGLLLAIPLIIFYVVAIVFRFHQFRNKFKTSKWVLKSIAVIIICIVPVVLLMHPYKERSKRTGFMSKQLVIENVPSIESYFFTSKGTMLWDRLSTTGNHLPRYWNQYLFPGAFIYICLILFIYLIVIKTKNRRGALFDLIKSPPGIFLLSGLIMSLFFIRINHFTLYELIYYVPGFGAMRALSRYITVELLFLGLIVAYVSKFMLQKCAGFKSLIFILLLGLFIIDNAFKKDVGNSVDKSLMQQRKTKLYEKVKHLPQGTIISYEPDTLLTDYHTLHLDVMLASQAFQLKCINGYSGSSPAGFGPYYFNPNEENRINWIKKSNLKEKVFVIN